MKNLCFANTEIKDGFWKYYSDLVREKTVHAVYDRFADTGRFDAFNCDWEEGKPNKPHIFWDSDIAKWIEGVAYLTLIKPEPELEKIVDNVVNLIEKNQREDGYYNSYYLTIEPENIFTNRDKHELYCTGHLIEAAIAYHKATGKDKLLNCMLKNIDYIYQIFVIEQSAQFTTPGHEEIELALLKLYKYLGNEKHLELAKFFLDKRCNNDKDVVMPNHQDDCPVREITEAKGHAVRAGYLYTAMAMLYSETKDTELKAACDRVFDNIVNCKMSITGGIGSKGGTESFTYNYDLPNSITYNETCAAISLAMFAGELQQLEANSLYGDIIEKIYYNGFISGISLDGKKFFYTNPLAIDLKKRSRAGEFHPICERVEVFSCSCCPPNVVRMLASLPRYMYTQDKNTIYCNQFASAKTEFEIDGEKATLIQETNYPVSGDIKFTYHGKPIKLCVRIPSWCVEYSGETKNGFAEFSMSDGDTVSLSLPMNVHFVEANPNVQDNSGRYAVMRGPIVYCMEAIDNGENLRDITIIENGNIRVETENSLAPILYIDAERRKATTELYRIKTDKRESFVARLIPYHTFANRGATDMLIWTMVK